MPHTALAGRSGCVQQEPAEDLCGGHPQEGRGIARLSVRTGASGQRRVEKNRARVAERGRDRAQPKKGDATLENAMGMFFALSLPWWVFPQPDFMLVRGGHRLAFCSLCVAAGARPE